MRRSTPPSSSNTFDSLGMRETFRVSLLGRGSVSELVVRYQNMFEGEKVSSAADNTQLFKSPGGKHPVKMEARGGRELNVVGLQSFDRRIPRSQSVEDFVLSRERPSARSGKNFSQGSFNSRRALSSSPSIGELLSKTSISTDPPRGPIETDKMAAVDRPNPRLKPQMGGLANSKRGREQGHHVLREDNLLGKEVQLTRRSKAEPSKLPASSCTSRKVNSHEKTVRVLGDAENRRHIPYQGHKISVFPSVKERSVLYSSHAAATAHQTRGLTEQNFIHKISSNPLDNQKANKAGTKEECAVCSQRVYMVERMTIQNLLLHHACFCCHHCGRKLSLLNYAISNGAFYCQVHYNLLPEVKGRCLEGNITNAPKEQEEKRVTQQNPVRVPQNVNNQKGKTLLREKIQPCLSGLYPAVGQRRSKGNDAASQSRTTWPPLRKPSEDVRWSSGRTKKLLPDPLVTLHSWDRTERSSHKAPGKKPIGDKSAPVDKEQNPLLRFPEKGEHVLYRSRILDGSRNLEALEKRQLLMVKSIHGDQVRKGGKSISEKAMMFQHNQLHSNGKVPVVSPLTAISPKLSPSGTCPFHSEPLRTMKAEVAAAGGSTLPSAHFGGKLGRSSSSNGERNVKRNGKQVSRRAEPLPDARMSLPVMASPEKGQERQLPETIQSNTVITSEHEETNVLGCVSSEPKEGHSQMNPEAMPVGLPERKAIQRLAAASDSPNVCFADRVSQQAPGGTDKQTRILYSESLERPESQLYPEIHKEEVAVIKEKEMQTGRKSDSGEKLNCDSDQVSEATKPKTKDACSTAEVERVGAHLGSSSKEGSPGSMGIFTPPVAHLEATKTANTNGELLREVSSENNILFKPLDDGSGEIIFQDSRTPGKEPQTSHSCEIPHLNEHQVSGDVKAHVKPPVDGTLSLQPIQSKATRDDSAKKHPLQKERRPSFPSSFASKTQDTTLKEPPVNKKAPKTQSALVTLFGCSSGKEKNDKQQQRKAPSQAFVEEHDEGQPQGVCSSNPPITGSSKQAEVPDIRTPEIKSKADQQDSEDGGNPRDGQQESSPSLANAKALQVNTFPTKPQADVSSRILPGTPNTEDSKQSDSSTEGPPRDHSKSTLDDNFQNDLTAPAKTLQDPTKPLVGKTSEINSWVGISSKINAASRDGHDDQGALNFPSVVGHGLEIKAGNTSLSSPSEESKVLLLDQDHQIPDMLLFPMEARVPRISQEGDPQLHFTLGTECPSEELSSHLCSSENPLQINGPHRFPERGPTAWNRNDCLNKQGLQFVTGNPYRLDFHGGQGSTDSYPTRGDNFPSLPATLQQIPELLRDTVQSKAGNQDVPMGSSQGDPLLAPESNVLSRSPP